MGLISDCWTIDLLLLFMSAFTIFNWFVKQRYTYWERNGFKSYPNPKFLLGHFGPAIKQKMYFGEVIASVYKNTSDPFVGIYGFLWPFLLACDPQAVRNILIKDFPHFTDRKYEILFLSIY